MNYEKLLEMLYLKSPNILFGIGIFILFWFFICVFFSHYSNPNLFCITFSFQTYFFREKMAKKPPFFNMAVETSSYH